MAPGEMKISAMQAKTKSHVEFGVILGKVRNILDSPSVPGDRRRFPTRWNHFRDAISLQIAIEHAQSSVSPSPSVTIRDQSSADRAN
jgi:hypothetical protein